MANHCLEFICSECGLEECCRCYSRRHVNVKDYLKNLKIKPKGVKTYCSDCKKETLHY